MAQNVPVQVPSGGDLVHLTGGSGALFYATADSMPQGAANAVSYTKAATGTNTLLAAGPARRVTIIITTDENFADGNGAKTVFTVGESGGSATKFVAAATIGTSAGNMIAASGLLTANAKVEVYATAATGTGTGGITAIVIANKASS